MGIYSRYKSFESPTVKSHLMTQTNFNWIEFHTCDGNHYINVTGEFYSVTVSITNRLDSRWFDLVKERIIYSENCSGSITPLVPEKSNV